MKPLSARKRRVYLVTLVLLFVLVVPLAILYAGGWRYKSGFGFVRTGGIFVSIPFDAASISLDGEIIGESGFLNHRLYLSDLAPSAYVIHVEKEGYRSWDKVLVVEAQLVTDAGALLIPEEITLFPVIVGPAATGTRTTTFAERARIIDAFSHPIASSSPDALARGDMTVVVENGGVSVHWGSTSHPPSNFCGRPSYCLPDISIEKGHQEAISGVLYAGGVLYATKEAGVFFSEADVRPTVSAVPIFSQAGADFRIVEGVLYIKHGKSLYQVVGL